MGHELRVNHAGAFADGGDADLLRRAIGASDFDAGEGGLLHRVGGQDGLGDLRKWSGSAPSEAASAGMHVNELLRRQRDADDAGGGGEDFLGLAGEDLGRGVAGGVGGVETGLAGGAVGVAGVDGHDAHLAAGGAEMLLVHDERRGGDAVGGEGGGGAGRRVGDDEGKVGAAAGFDAGLDGAKAKSAGNDESGKVSHRSVMRVNPFNLAGGWGLEALRRELRWRKDQRATRKSARTSSADFLRPARR